MITGYNTDVRHGEVVLHVQTEDKGLDNPYLESVIYVRGQVLAPSARATPSCSRRARASARSRR